MVVWFATLASLGLVSIVHTPSILWSLNPWYAFALFAHAPWTAFVALGSVVLAVTGCEALYADMGHFGKEPIRYAWLYFVLPALLLNYFGQGAAILHDPRMASVAFFSVVPLWAHYPMVLLATIATIIASQAVISGVYSITRQAVQLGQLPRMEIRHTSAIDVGQIYVPRMNTYLCVGVVLIVLIFKSVVGAGRGLRHRGDGRDGHQHMPRRHRGRAPMGLGLAHRASRVRIPRADRCRVPRVQFAQDRGRRLAAAC